MLSITQKTAHVDASTIQHYFRLTHVTILFINFYGLLFSPQGMHPLVVVVRRGPRHICRDQCHPNGELKSTFTTLCSANRLTLMVAPSSLRDCNDKVYLAFIISCQQVFGLKMSKHPSSYDFFSPRPPNRMVELLFSLEFVVMNKTKSKACHPSGG